ncbi:MAG: MBOAT family protein [Rhodobiaceae bacterium]|nr:MBOAT family protein [Rhodobiaceae bacterium]
MASVVFYGWWSVPFLGLLIVSCTFNYLVGKFLRRSPSKPLLWFGIAANIALIAFFKYLPFFAGEAGLALTGPLADIVLPIGISFYTFQQISFLVDSYRRERSSAAFFEYVLFVIFFPQLIAGPIMHHSDTIPQIKALKTSEAWKAFALSGPAYFVFGLSLKVLVADTLAPWADRAFDLAQADTYIGLATAWLGISSYTMQIYFDFAGYSLMAIGLAQMLGIVIPVNFYSPYKSTSIIEFWRRWHITLSRFLRDYVYIPLGGNRVGAVRQNLNLFLTMLIGGIWHGAGWTFMVWGALHGLYIVANHAWRRTGIAIPRLLGWAMTMVGVGFAWIYFRSETMEAAENFIGALTQPITDIGTIADETAPDAIQMGAVDWMQWAFVAGVCLIAFLAPNVVQILSRFGGVLMVSDLAPLPSRLGAMRTAHIAVATILLGFISGATMYVRAFVIGAHQPFLYFQF